MRALPAKYMITPLILLNWLTALNIGTHLGICKNPIQISLLIQALHLPLFIHLAISRSVLLLPTFEAKLIAALALNNLFFVGKSLDGQIAFFGERTPFYVFVVVGERLAVPSHVSFEDG